MHFLIEYISQFGSAFGGSGGSSVQIRRNHHYRNWSLDFLSRNTHQSQAKVMRF